MNSATTVCLSAELTEYRLPVGSALALGSDSSLEGYGVFKPQVLTKHRRSFLVGGEDLPVKLSLKRTVVYLTSAGELPAFYRRQTV